MRALPPLGGPPAVAAITLPSGSFSPSPVCTVTTFREILSGWGFGVRQPRLYCSPWMEIQWRIKLNDSFLYKFQLLLISNCAMEFI
jgi:hypothetical protein